MGFLLALLILVHDVHDQDRQIVGPPDCNTASIVFRALPAGLGPDMLIRMYHPLRTEGIHDGMAIAVFASIARTNEVLADLATRPDIGKEFEFIACDYRFSQGMVR
jgi:hypothetical protein